MTFNQVQDSVVRNMAEGVLIIDFDGTIRYANQAACSILEIPESKLSGKKFASLFFDDPSHDDFSQILLDAIYSKDQPHEAVVPFRTEGAVRHLHVTTSFYMNDESHPFGITMLISDLSELMDLKDALKAMDQIRELNQQLNARNELLSKTFGQFLSDEIVRQLLDSPDGLVPGGNKETVTIMMSDLRGFTAISERMDPDDLICMLNHYLGAMTDIIQKWNGTIIEFIGDGIMAVFGAPVSSETHAADAVAAALEMESAMEEINRWNMEKNYPFLEMGIGINTGEMIVGNIGSEKRMKYGVVGKQVNLCGRIESYTVGKQVLISPDVKAQIQSPLQIEMEMTVIPKGVDEEIVLSHVTGIGEPYDVYIAAEKAAMETLKVPLPVSFCRIQEKHTMKKTYYGGIISLGRDCAVLETGTKLQLFDNIQITAGGRLFCKVMEALEDSYILQYTSIPSGYDRWIREALAKQ